MASTSLSFSDNIVFTRGLPTTTRSSPARFDPHRPSNISAVSQRNTNSALEMMSSSSSLYEVLGVRTGATCQEIKSAYRKLAKVLHPDTAAGASSDGGDCSTSDEFILLHAAYATLSDPEKRAMYDVSLFRRRRVAVTGGGGSTRLGRRTWETDQCW